MKRSFPFVILLLAAAAFGQAETSINKIQGSGDVSPMQGTKVRTSGIVTARIKNGFFIQTPDDKTDSDPKTSEGIYIFTGSRSEPPTEAAVGTLVTVTGTVEEFRRNNEPLSLTITEINFRQGSDSLTVSAKDQPLPKAVEITVADMKPNSANQLERFEGMRVSIPQLMVVAPTDGRVIGEKAIAESNGTFFGVVNGMPRPFREPGLEIEEVMAMDPRAREKLKTDFPKMPLFDSNPERIRIESFQQFGTRPIDVGTNSRIAGLTGVLHYSYRTNTLLVDPGLKLSITQPGASKPMPAIQPGQFSIAGMNLENFFDDVDDPGIKEPVVESAAFQDRLKKISLAVRTMLGSPDVIGVIEIENIAALKKLASRLNADVVAAGGDDPRYEAFLIEGNDGRGIDNGFLVKASRIKVLEVKQFGKDEKYKHPQTGEEIFLNDRPPLVLRGSIASPGSGEFEFTAIVNHLKSYLGYNDPKQQDNVRLKKRLQAEYLANLVQQRQKADPQEHIILLGDFNSFQFSDGVLDMIGTIKGTPSAKDAVINSSPDLVEPNLINLIDMMSATERYSFAYDGNAQTLDHILITENLRPHIFGVGFARVNADFPESMRGDSSRLERFSDHDPVIAYFMLAPRR